MPADKSGKDWLYAAGGAAIGGLLIHAFWDKLSDPDEERPPILVRNGSLIFQSGKVGGTGHEGKGKPWKTIDQKKDRWQQDHEKAKKVQWLVVELTPKSGCPRVSLTQGLSISYASETFTIEIAAPKKSKRPALTIVGPDLYEAPGTGDNPQLIYSGDTGTITNVTFTNWEGHQVSCDDPGEFTIWQL